jgi:hypothetical protein
MIFDEINDMIEKQNSFWTGGSLLLWI